MGYRTTVILYNDQSAEWKNDPELGRKIAHAMNFAMSTKESTEPEASLGYGRVVQCAHADTQTIGILDSYYFRPLAHGHWHHGQSVEDMKVELLKRAADELGYKLVKKPVKA